MTTLVVDNTNKYVWIYTENYRKEYIFTEFKSENGLYILQGTLPGGADTVKINAPINTTTFIEISAAKVSQKPTIGGTVTPLFPSVKPDVIVPGGSTGDSTGDSTGGFGDKVDIPTDKT